MPFVSITRLRVRRRRHLVQFFWHALRSIAQSTRADGYLAGGTSREPGRVFWTATVWRDSAAMRAFRNSGAHMKAMPVLIRICDEASFGHWEQEGSEMPSPEAMHRRMLELGKISKVREPTADHAAGRTASDRVPRALRQRP